MPVGISKAKARRNSKTDCMGRFSGPTKAGKNKVYKTGKPKTKNFQPSGGIIMDKLAPLGYKLNAQWRTGMPVYSNESAIEYL